MGSEARGGKEVGREQTHGQTGLVGFEERLAFIGGGGAAEVFCEGGS